MVKERWIKDGWKCLPLVGWLFIGKSLEALGPEPRNHLEPVYKTGDECS